MNLRTPSFSAGFSVVLVLAVSIPGLADTYLQQKKRIFAHEYMGKKIPERTRKISTWMTTDKIRMDENSAESIIILTDRKKIYFVDHFERTFVELPLKDYKEEEADVSAGSDAAKRNFSIITPTEVSVTPLEESRRFGRWICRKYILRMRMPMGSSTIEIYASEEVKADYSLYNKISNLIFLLQPHSQAHAKEIEKIKGFPVYSIEKSEIRGLERTSSLELVDIREAVSPAGIYEIPFGYTPAGAR